MQGRQKDVRDIGDLATAKVNLVEAANLSKKTMPSRKELFILDTGLMNTLDNVIIAENGYCGAQQNMKDLVTFYLAVRYRAPSRESLFLGKGWGLRDVRGPYLDGFVGHISIAGAILSSEIPSTISLVLSASNRCPTPFILAKVSTSQREVSKNVCRNASADFVLDSIYASSKNDLEILVQLPGVTSSSELKDFWTILAVDELTIERFQ